MVADQPLVTVETDKAVVEIPAPASGRVTARFGTPGDVIKTGATLIEFESLSAGDDAGTVVGELPTTVRTQQSERAQPRTRVRASPAVRTLAARLGVDLSLVEGSGPHGSVTRDDVESAAETAATPGSAEPLRGVRRAMAHNMSRAHAQVVPATLTEEVDVQPWSARSDVTLRLINAVAVACANAPALNAWYLGPEHGRRLHTRIDLGIAMDTSDGLFVPVLRDVANRGIDDLRLGLDRMKRDVQARCVPAEELRGPTISLSNFGMIAGLHAALVVMPPQVAIVGAGRIRDCVVPCNGQPAIRRTLPISLTFDHRAVTGGEAARFMACMVSELGNADEHPVRSSEE